MQQQAMGSLAIIDRECCNKYLGKEQLIIENTAIIF